MKLKIINIIFNSKYFYIISNQLVRIDILKFCFLDNDENFTQEISTDLLKIKKNNNIYSQFYKLTKKIYVKIESKNLILLHIKKAILKNQKNFYQKKESTFRLKQRDFIIDRFSKKDKFPKEVLNKLANFYFFEKYSVWMYCEFSEIFTCDYSNYDLKDNIITDEKNDLLDFLNRKDKNSQIITPHSYLLPENEGQCYETCIIVKIEVNNLFNGVLVLLSKVKNYTFNDKYLGVLKRSIEDAYMNKAVKDFNKMFELNEKIIELTNNEIQENEDSKNSIFDEINNIVVSSLHFETSSIFFKEDNKLELYSSVTKCKGINQNIKSEPIYYDIDSDTLTSNAFNSPAPYTISSDIAHDERNKGHFSEDTSLDSRLFIAIKINFPENGIGILRVKNRYKIRNNKIEYTNLKALDLLLLRQICNYIGHTKVQIEDYTGFKSSISDLQDINSMLKKKLIETNDYYNLVMHEFRNPLNTFSLVPIYISQLLQDVNMESNKKNSINMFLNDMQVIVERLSVITNVNNLDQLLKDKQTQPYFILKDIIKPVVNMVEKGYEINDNTEIICDDNSLRKVSIICNKSLMNIVMNCLIDNAVKYSKESKNKHIYIYGEDNNTGYFNIYIENNGFEITETDLDVIFKKKGRGEYVKNHNYMGTGTGLFIVKSLLEFQNGTISLDSNYNPVRFKLELEKEDFFGEYDDIYNR